MMKHVRAYLIGLFVGIAGFASAAGIPLLTGAQDPSQMRGNFNDLITKLNTIVYLYGTTNTGELEFRSAQSWAANSNVATTMTSLGPQGSNTTVQEWLVVTNRSGTVRFIPAY